MCRLAGIIFKKQLDFTKLIAMADHQKRGGPDRIGFWQHENVGFAHNRLAIVDLADTGNQPMESDRFVLIYNGELYNHHEMRNKIGPMFWPSHSDTLTLLRAIEHKGIDWTLDNAEGMWSFAAWDKYEKKLYLAVDPFGIKPMYYLDDADQFACASSPAALTKVKKMSFNRDSLVDMLDLGACKESLFSGVKRLNRGELLTWHNGHFTVKKYYSPKEQTYLPFEAVNEVLYSCESIRMSDVPIHLFLSGGIDSTVVASKNHFMNAVHLDSPEKQYAEQVSRKYNNPMFVVHPKEYDAEICLKDYAENSGDCSAAAIIPYIVSKEVSKLGKVAVSANGSDEIFYGYNRMLPKPSPTQYKHIFRGFNSSWRNDYTHTSELELDTYVQYDLNKTLDFASMCWGLEVRVPYLNKSVVESATSLTRSDHVNGHGNKSLLKNYLEGEGFDKNFLDRPKCGFSLYSQPIGYESLKDKGVNLLKTEFGIDPKFYPGRDLNYYRAAAAAFYCWWEIWKDKL